MSGNRLTSCGGPIGPAVLLTTELRLVELGVPSAAGEQFGVCAALRDAAVLDDEDDVGGADRREPVSDHYRRPSAQRLGERLLNSGFGCGVQRGGGLVQHDHARASEQ